MTGRVEPPVDLTGRRALVTGASRNLGAEVAHALARHGAVVAIGHRRSPEAAGRLAARLRAEHGGDHVAVAGDVARPEEATALVASAADRLGGIEILVNAVGPFSMTPYVDLTAAEWDRVCRANVHATFRCSREAMPFMRAAGWGRIVNFSAVSARVRNRSVYGLAKAAVEVLTEQLALEAGPEITVNAIAPGQIRESLDEMASLAPGWAATVAARTPMGRLVTRVELAGLVVALCGPEFDLVTGVTFPVDGGLGLPRS